MTGESVETGAPCAEGERRICELFGEVGPCRFSGITEYRNRFGEPGLRGERVGCAGAPAAAGVPLSSGCVSVK